MPTTRLECYGKIRDHMKYSILEYYKQHPDRLGDNRSQLAIAESMRGLEEIFNILDGYDIRRLPPKP